MLIYHPAQDVNHCVYRVFLIFEYSDSRAFDIELYRMLDFYMLFPHLLKLIKPLPSSLRAKRKNIMFVEAPFESMKNSKRVLHELEALQTVAIKSLLAKGFLSKEEFDNGVLRRTEKELPTSLLEEIKNARLPREEWFDVLVNDFPGLKFSGRDGLKARSGLMEYRYDMEVS